MRLSPRRALALLVATAVPLLVAAAEDLGLGRVRSMSTEERARMLKALETFDGLDRVRRDAIRALNDRIQALDPETRKRYLAVLRRYHTFYMSLPDEKRKALDAEADPTKRLGLIAELHAEQKRTAAATRTLSEGLQVSSLSPLRLRWLARELIVYFSLDPAKDASERAEFARLKTQPEREAFAQKIIGAKGLRDRAELRAKLREEDEEFRAAMDAVFRDPALRERFRKGQVDPAKPADAPKKKAGVGRPRDEIAEKLKDLNGNQRELIHKLDEQRVLRDLDEEKVDPGRLARFEAALPPWARASIDDLPPDAARRRLKALYRLVFPSPEEMPSAKPPPPPAARKAAPPASTGPTRPF